MPRTPRARFQRAFEFYLEELPLLTPLGRVLDERPNVYLGAPSGRHEAADMWIYRPRSPHEMLFGFVEYATDVGLFCSVDRVGESVRQGEGASVQLNLASAPGLTKRGAELVLSHNGRATRGRGGISSVELARLINTAAPEAVSRLGPVTEKSWPIELGTTEDFGALLDRLFVYGFAIEQAKRLLSQDPDSTKRRGTSRQQLLPSLDTVDGSETTAEVEHQNGGGQGYGLTPAARKAVEKHAEQLATDYFVAAGYQVRGVGKPYDLECSKIGEVLRVEVKGTTTPGAAVDLTIGEVRHAREFGAVALFVVSGITFDRRGNARGGTQWLWHPWKIDDAALAPVRFTYALDRDTGRKL